MTDLKIHPAAEIFPLADDRVEELAESMRKHGYDDTHPILLYDGMILDGRNRYRAAQLAEQEPVYADVSTAVDPYAESWKHNGVRRDLTPKQRAAIQLLALRRSKEWQEEQEARRQAADEARSAAAKAQHAVSNPRKGQKIYGPVSRDTGPEPARKRDEIGARAAVSGATVARVERAAREADDPDEELKRIARGDSRKRPSPRKKCKMTVCPECGHEFER